MPAEPSTSPQVSERGAPRGGQPQTLDRRLFMQLLAFGRCPDASAVGGAMAEAGVEGVVYEDLNDHAGIAVLTMHPDPEHFVGRLRRLLNREPLGSLVAKPQYTMLGRTYALGYEPDLEEALFHRPRRTLLNPAWPWAIWYPLRRRGSFAQLPEPEQRAVLGEHGAIGHAFGKADLAHDIRLACHGLDANDNDFVIGLVGRQLHPLSAIVQRMRQTKQTSQYLERLGPFLVGRAVWQSPVPPAASGPGSA